jgi:predicted XRE-type DNA-binding protein
VKRKSAKAQQAAESKSATPARPPGRPRSGASEKPLIPKAELAQEIATIIRYHHLNQTEAARIVGDAPSQMSLLMSGKLEGFSTERLLRMLLRLGRDIELVFRPAPQPRSAKFRITHKTDLEARA